MSSMEPEMKNFLAKIATSISWVLLWMLVNSTVGIGFNFAFFETSPSIGNYIFYVWLVGSFIFLVVYLSKKWKGNFEEFDDHD